MKLFGLNLGKEQPMSFADFRDQVRLTARRNYPNARLENNDNGFNMTIDGKVQSCNLRQLYSGYLKSTGDREALIKEYLKGLVALAPTHSWSEVMPLLRPSLRSAAFVSEAQRSLQKNKDPDSLPSQPFVGDLNVIAVVDTPGQAWGVTQSMLDGWGATMEDVMHHALNNMSMMRFPDPHNALYAGNVSKKSGGIREEVGLIFENNYLTATWLIMDRFRDYVGQRLQGNYVVSVPSRSKLTAVRADEPGLIANIQQSHRNIATIAYALTPKLFHVNCETTGGIVSVYEAAGKGATIGADSLFAAGQSSALPNISQAAGGMNRPAGRDLNDWGSLNEPTEEPTPPPVAGKKSGSGRL